MRHLCMFHVVGPCPSLEGANVVPCVAESYVQYVMICGLRTMGFANTRIRMESGETTTDRILLTLPEAGVLG
jgi:hypothetical protein